MNTNDNPDPSKDYVRGSKNSWDKTTKTFKLSNKHLEFMDLFIELKKEQGFHKLAFTRTDLLETAIKSFAANSYKSIMDNASDSLKYKFLENDLIKQMNNK